MEDFYSKIHNISYFIKELKKEIRRDEREKILKELKKD